MGRVAVSKTGRKNSLPRRVGSGALVGRVPVPKTGQKNSLPRRDASGVPVGRVVVPKQIVRRIIMVEVKVLVGYAPWQMVSGGIGSRKGKGPTKWEGPPGTICHGAIMDRLFLRRRHWLPKRRGPRSGKDLPAPSATEQSWTGYFSSVGIGSRKEGPDGDKWSKTTQETLGGSGGSEANGALRNPYHPPGVTIYIEKNIYRKETD